MDNIEIIIKKHDKDMNCVEQYKVTDLRQAFAVQYL
jgi:hypothetical protein